ncbi:MAG: type ISP restriction/modification enzyme [Rubrobacteraceae bacterium]
MLGSPAYTESFSEELAIPGPRVPITKSAELFRRGAELGRALIQLHTYGERFGPDGKKVPVPRGRAEYARAIPDTPEGYPEDYAYDPDEEVLRVGDGEIQGVDERVWNYEVSGLRVVRSWLGYRMKEAAGRSSSPLDEIRPERWTGEMTVELLELLWVLEATVEREPELAAFLEEVTAGPIFEAEELPLLSEDEKKPPKKASEPVQDELGLS